MKKITFVIGIFVFFLFSFCFESLSAFTTEGIKIPSDFEQAANEISKEMSKYAKENKLTLLAYLEGVDCSKLDSTGFGIVGTFTCKITDRLAYENSVAYFSQFLSTGMRESSDNQVGDYSFDSNVTANLTEQDNDILEFQLIKSSNLPINTYYLRNFEEDWKFKIQVKSLIPKIFEKSETAVKLNTEMLAMVDAFKKQFPTMSLKQNSPAGLVFQNLPKEVSYDYIGPTVNGKILKHYSVFGGFDGSDINGKIYTIDYVYQKLEGISDFERIATKKGISGAFIINYTDNEITFVDIKDIPEFKMPELLEKSNTDTVKSKSLSSPTYTRDEEYLNQNRQYDFYYDENGNPVIEYLKEDYELLKKKYGSDDFFYGFVDIVEFTDNYSRTERTKNILMLDADYYSFQEMKNSEGKDIIKIVFNKSKFIQDIKKQNPKMETIHLCSILSFRNNTCSTLSPVISDILENKNIEKYFNKTSGNGVDKNIIGNMDPSNLLISIGSLGATNKIQISLKTPPEVATKNTQYTTFLEYLYKKYSQYQRIGVKMNYYGNGDEITNDFQFDISKDREAMIDFSIENLLFLQTENIKLKKSGSYSDLYKDKEGNSYVKITGEKAIETSLNIQLGNSYNCFYFPNGNTNIGTKVLLDCSIYGVNGSSQEDLKISIQPLLIENSIFINLSDLYQQISKKPLDLKNIEWISLNLNDVDYFYQSYPKDNLLQFIDNIATPKTVSSNPFVIGINGLFALLYLLLFYLTGALFNSYFQEKGNELSINTKMISYWTKFWSKVYIGLKKVLAFLRLEKISILKNAGEKIESITIKRSHKINILIGILVLGIINSIIVGSFDITSVNGWFVICLLIFATGLLTLLKDMILYLLVKKEDRGLKIELIPSGYILASIIAIFVRITNIVPGTIFGSAVRMNTETTTAKRKVGNGRKLFIALLTAYTIGIIFWFSSILIPETSFWNKFVLLNYFSIATDTFFTLLPFGLFWGVSILKDKKFKLYWFMFIFFATFTLFHTIFNTKGDFNQILSLQSYNMNLFIGVLIFWMITLGGFWYFQFYRKTKKVDYSF
ncbi:MAG: hypothetical protein PHQ95_04445 [Candidatus Gracilibacteria bacterium]|nr:hypothetical protein [Candidatus Gracilibacteria bacterium]